MDDYIDRFRDVTVRRGTRIKTKELCSACNVGEVDAFEVFFRTMMGDPNRNKSAGFDYWCRTCSYKWKTMENLKRPGLYIRRDAKPDEKYMKEFGKEIKTYLQGLSNEYQRRISKDEGKSALKDARGENYLVISRAIWEAVIAEVKDFGTYFEHTMLLASHERDVDEDKVDTVWGYYYSYLHRFETARNRTEDPMGSAHMPTDLHARQYVLSFQFLFDLWIGKT